MKSELTAKCEAEQLETYNRRDNIKILQLREDINENGNFVGENMEHTMQKVLQLSQKLDAKIDEKDISIAHRLPTRKGNIRPIIVKFSRRVAKVEILRKKKILFENKKQDKSLWRCKPTESFVYEHDAAGQQDKLSTHERWSDSVYHEERQPSV